MRLTGAAQVRVRPAVITTALYAGNKRIREGRESYFKENWAIWRTDGPQREPILRYPYAEGQTWKSLDGKGKEWTVVSTGTAVAVAAGFFAECLKVKEHDLRYAGSWRYDYYCPGAGRVKTTVGGPGFENPNTELSRLIKMNWEAPRPCRIPPSRFTGVR